MTSGARSLSPAKRQFELVLGGYSPSDVEDCLRVANAELQRLVADRDAAVTQADRLATQLEAAWSATEHLHVQISRIAASPDTVEGIIARLQWMLRVYRDEVSEIRSRAEAAAGATKAAALAEAAELDARGRRQSAQLDAESTRMRAEIGRNRSETLAELDRLAQQANERRAALDATAQAHRAEADEDFAISQSARRADAEAEFAELEAQRRTEADRIRTEAAAKAERMVADATDTARRMLDAARAEVAQQLRQRAGQSGQTQSAPDERDPAAASHGRLPTESIPNPRHSDEPVHIAG
jgi:hypothetical protein